MNFSQLQSTIDLQSEIAKLIKKISAHENARLTLAFKFCHQLEISVETPVIKIEFESSSSIVHIYESSTGSYFHDSEFMEAVPQELHALIKFETEITVFLDKVELAASSKYTELLQQKQEAERFLTSLAGN